MMRQTIMIAVLVPILGILNYGIYKGEQVKKHGETLLFEIVIKDPRSLMQGDYMDLHYAIEEHALTQGLPSNNQCKYMVIIPDENHVARFVRFHQGEILNQGEKLIRFYYKSSSIRIKPNSFFFQENQAKEYAKAKYAIFKFDHSGNYLLTGLANGL
jgi:uncharacterized membrane-anchored protein